MIRLVSALEVRTLLLRVLRLPERFEQLVVCSPFIDGEVTEILVSLAQVTRLTQCGFRVLTRLGGGDGLLARLPGHPSQWRSTVVGVARLHAKAYLAVGRGREHTCAIVTSANLTGAGLAKNLELGVAALPSSDAGRRLVSETRAFLERLIDVPRRSLSINDPWRAA